MPEQDLIHRPAKWSSQSRLKSEIQAELLARLCDGKISRAGKIVADLDVVCKSANFRWRCKRVGVQVLLHRGRRPDTIAMLEEVLGSAATNLAVDSFDKYFGEDEAAVEAELARFATSGEARRVQTLRRKPERDGFVK